MILFIVVLFAGFLWGVSEGITMIKYFDRNAERWLNKFNDGARLHVWFRWYHLIDGLAFAGVGVIGYLLSTHFPSWIFLVGAGLLGWQAKETGYSFSRWRTLMDYTEHINFFDLIEKELSTKLSIIFTATRLMIGITFIILGGFK